jgi:hypothetical protein
MVLVLNRVFTVHEIAPLLGGLKHSHELKSVGLIRHLIILGNCSVKLTRRFVVSSREQAPESRSGQSYGITDS